ncbi:MAG: helix-turn-helix domain-containing protein [Candidatus Binatia bacterium]
MEEKRLVGRRIKKLRKAKGLSQEKLAELAGTSPKYLSRIETGRENPTLDLFARLAKGLQIDLYEIFLFEHEGEQLRRLHKKLESLITTAKDKDLVRLTPVLEALVHYVDASED